VTGNSFGSRAMLKAGRGTYEIHRLDALEKRGLPVARLPYSLKILLENLLRREDGRVVRAEDVEKLARWNAAKTPDEEIAFMPARVLMQDFTGVPAVVDLASMRAAVKLDAGDLARKDVSMAKIVVSEGLHKAVDTAIQLMGARGYSKDTPLEWMYRYARQARLVDGASEVHKMVLARFLLSEGQDFWSWD